VQKEGKCNNGVEFAASSSLHILVLALCNFYLRGTLKDALRGGRLADDNVELKLSVHGELRRFSEVLLDRHRACQVEVRKCVDTEGEFVGKYAEPREGFTHDV